MGAPGVLPPFAIGLGAPGLANAYGGGIPSLGAFALASSGALGSGTPGALRGLSNVLLVSNLNEEVIFKQKTLVFNFASNNTSKLSGLRSFSSLGFSETRLVVPKRDLILTPSNGSKIQVHSN